MSSNLDDLLTGMSDADLLDMLSLDDILPVCAFSAKTSDGDIVSCNVQLDSKKKRYCDTHSDLLAKLRKPTPMTEEEKAEKKAIRAEERRVAKVHAEGWLDKVNSEWISNEDDEAIIYQMHRFSPVMQVELLATLWEDKSETWNDFVTEQTSDLTSLAKQSEDTDDDPIIYLPMHSVSSIQEASYWLNGEEGNTLFVEIPEVYTGPVSDLSTFWKSQILISRHTRIFKSKNEENEEEETEEEEVEVASL